MYYQSSSSAGPSATDFTGYIPISTPQDLAKIGNSSYPAYPLSGSYYLTNDIVFTPADDINGGIDIGISVMVSGTNITVTLNSLSDEITSLRALLGRTSVSSSSNAATLSGIPSGTYNLIIDGTADSYLFAYSTQIDTSTSGEKTPGVTFNSNGNFYPIGTLSSPFTGIFDGDDHKISGMNVSVSTYGDAYAGLFGYADGAQIQNLGITDSNIVALPVLDGAVYAGGIVGYANSSATISNCYNAGAVSASSSYFAAFAGGIVGYMVGSTTISNCYNIGEVSVSSSFYDVSAGGIVGSVAGSITITDSYNMGNVSATVLSSSPIAYASGMIGYMQDGLAIITNCYNTGNVSVTVSSYAYVGGIVCYAYSAAITNCYNTGDMSAVATQSLTAFRSSYAYVGGIVGNIDDSVTLTNCYNTGDVSAKTSSSASSIADVGGIAGSITSATITNCYNTGNVSAAASSSSSLFYTVYACAGGIVGYVGTSATIANCCFLEGVASHDSVSEDRICGNITGPSSILNDGGTGDQASGAKTMEQMTPTLQNAQNGNSIYYVGSGGWDFSDGGLWTIVEGVNNGYPILQPLADSALVVPTTYTVTLTPKDGCVLSPYGGSYSPVNSGGSYRFTISILEGYDGSSLIVKVNSLPLTPVSGVYTISNITENMTVTVDGVSPIHVAIPGDLDGNGSLNNIDVMMLMTYLAGGGATIDLGLADMNGDGQVNNIDIMLMMTILAGG